MITVLLLLLGEDFHQQKEENSGRQEIPGSARGNSPLALIISEFTTHKFQSTNIGISRVTFCLK